MINKGEKMKTSNYRYFHWVAALTVAVLVISNVLVPKLISVGPFVVTGAIVLFPLAYILSDVTVEVYGYAKTREVIWMTLATQGLMVVTFAVVSVLPSINPEMGDMVDTVIAQVPRVVVASMLGLWAGKFANAISMSWLKKVTNRRFLWLRAIGSSVPGQIADSGVFFTLAFIGIAPGSVVLSLVYTGVLTKLVYEVLAIPFTYAACSWLKRAEEMDPLDYGVNYNPFKVKA